MHVDLPASTRGSLSSRGNRTESRLMVDGPLFDAQVVVVERLFTLMHFNVEVWVILLEPCFDQGGASLGGIIASDQSDQFVAIV